MSEYSHCINGENSALYYIDVKAEKCLTDSPAINFLFNFTRNLLAVVQILCNFAPSLKIKRLMVKHIILWTLNPELSAEEKNTVKAGIKAGLEGLVGKVPGLLDVKVHVDGRLDSSNVDVMLDSTLESPEALKGYAQHPDHVDVANTKVRPYTVQRSCLDFEI